MAFTGSPVDSVERTDQQTSDKVSVVDNAQLKFAKFSYTHAAGAGVGEINLVKLPAGKINIYNLQSRIVSSAMVATADLHLGTRAYTQEDGTAVVEAQATFAADLDAGSAINQAWPLPVAGVTAYDTKEGLEIYCEIDTANIEDTDTINGWVAYTHA